MKTHVLTLAASLAVSTAALAQNDAAPAASTNAAPAAAPVAAPAAQDTPAQTPPAASPKVEAAPAKADPAADAAKPTGNEKVPLIVIDDVPLLDAVKNLARQAGLNYLPDPKLLSVTNQPNVTLRLEDVTAQDALTAVLDTYNLQIINDPRIKVSRITVKDPKAADPQFTKIYQLKNIQPTNIVDIIKKGFTDARSSVMGDPRTSQLIVLATEKELLTVEDTIGKLDTPTRQVLIEAQLWETARNPKTVKGIDWAGTFAAQNISYGNAKLDKTKSSVTTTTPGDPITIPTPGGGSTTITPKSQTTENFSYIPGNGITLDTVKGFHPATAFLNADGLSAVVSFFNTDNDTEIVATPRAVTLDHQQAQLSVTRAFPIFKITPGSANSPAGSEITYTNLGTILNVTPHITANSNIALQVIPEVSDVAGQDRQIINGFENVANIYAIRRMETHVLIPSGNTLVLGGLISDRTKNANNKVPLLGDIPYLGRYLFSKESKERDKANLIVFITPTVIGDENFQSAPGSIDFLKTKKVDRPDTKESWFDSGKPYDWTRPRKSDEAAKPAASASAAPAPVTVASVSTPAPAAPEAAATPVAPATTPVVVDAAPAPAAPAVEVKAPEAPAPAPAAPEAPAAPSNDSTPAK